MKLVLLFLALLGVALSWPTTVQTTSGYIQGTYIQDDNINEFLGIPYAAPPVGNMRWKPSVSHPVWPGVRSANSFSSACIQTDNAGVIPAYTFPDNVTFSEDCLTLNVWAPNSSSGSKKVMVWFHGGGLQEGGNSELRLRGSYLANANDVIVINVNYRLGLMGFLAHPDLYSENPAYPTTGNYGLLDQRLALEWVRDNVHLFGGDPKGVTISGESAGGTSVCLHLCMPGSKGLFSQAIIESGACFDEVSSMSRNEVSGLTLQKDLGCPQSTPADVLECMRSKPASEILKYQGDGVTAQATVDGYAIVTHPFNTVKAGNFTKVPLIAGNVLNEGTLFVAYLNKPIDKQTYMSLLQSKFKQAADLVAATYPCDAYDPKDCRIAYAYVVGDFTLACPTMMMSKMNVKTTTTYGYVWTHAPSWTLGSIPPLGAYHSSEIAFVYSTLDLIPYYRHTQEETDLGHELTQYWGTFVRTGSPNYQGAPVQWPVLTPSNDTRIVLDVETKLQYDYNAKQCSMWEEVYKAVYDV